MEPVAATSGTLVSGEEAMSAHRIQQKRSGEDSMSRLTLRSSGLLFGLTALTCAAVGSTCYGGGAFFGANRAVGGVAVTPEGVLETPTVEDQRELEQIRQQTRLDVPAALDEFTELRAVSLKQLEATIAAARSENKPLPPEAIYLAGLQRVRYVFVYPEQGDVVLVGPAEGWKVDGLGNVVGRTTNRPVLLLDDLIVALRTGGSSRLNPITCSIDPTPAGLERVQAVVSQLTAMGNPDETLKLIEDALGPQQISVTGVPVSSHFARVMVAADFRMKRLAMAFDPSPVPGLPDYLSMIPARGRGVSNMMPRWWLAPNYEPLARTEDGLAWELRGPGVQCLTEEDRLSETGERTHTGQAGSAAAQWAKNMTDKFAELSEHDSSFGHLRNVMDLAVVGALIEKEQMLAAAGLQMPWLMQREELLAFRRRLRRPARQARSASAAAGSSAPPAAWR